MTKAGPILVIDDDADDQEVLRNVFQNLRYSNEIVFFSNGEDALQYLGHGTNIPFLILSDINMPRMDGFELRSRIQSHEKDNLKDIPFLFFSTGANKQSVKDAYAMSVQGFFIKPANMKEWEEVIRNVVDYWHKSIVPNQY